MLFFGSITLVRGTEHCVKVWNEYRELPYIHSKIGEQTVYYFI